MKDDKYYTNRKHQMLLANHFFLNTILNLKS